MLSSAETFTQSAKRQFCQSFNPWNAKKTCIWKCRLFMSSAEYSCKLFKPFFFAYRQTVCTLIRLLLEEQSDLGPHCLQKKKKMTFKITSRWQSRRQLLCGSYNFFRLVMLICFMIYNRTTLIQLQIIYFPMKIHVNCLPKKLSAWANSENPEQTPQNAVSDQGLHHSPLIQ